MTVALTAVGVQHVTITIASGATTGTATISAVGAGCRMTWQGASCSETGAQQNDSNASVSYTGTTVTATRGATGTSIAMTIHVTLEDFDTTNVMNSVQYGTVSITTTNSSGTASISSVTNSNAVVHYLGQNTATSLTTGYTFFTRLSLATTTMTATRAATSITSSTVVTAFCVAEFVGAALNSSTQQLTVTGTNSGTTAAQTISSVTLVTACLAWGGFNENALANPAQGMTRAAITGTTTVTISWGTLSSLNSTTNVTVADIASALLLQNNQRGTIALSSSSSNTATITSAALAQTLANWLGSSNTLTSVNPSTQFLTLVQTSATVLTMSSNAATAGTGSYETITYKPFGPYLITSLCSAGTTSALNTTGANFLVAVVSSNNSVTSISDSQSNTWTKLTTYGSSNSVAMYYCYSPTTSASHTFTPGASFASICVMAFAQVNGSFDVQNGTASNNATTVSAGSITPGTNYELVIAGVGFNAAGTYSINSGLTGVIEQNYSSGVNVGVAMAYLVQVTAATIAPTWTTTVAPTAGGADIASFGKASTILTINFNATFETIATWNSDVKSPLESTANESVDRLILGEMQSGLTQDIIIPQDFQISLRNDGTSYFENLGTQIKDDKANLETSGNISIDSLLPEDTQAKAVSDIILPQEFGLKVTNDAIVYSEIIGQQVKDANLSLETYGNIRADRLVTFETGTSNISDMPIRAESVSGAIRDATAPFETAGAVVVTADSLLRLEAVANMKTDLLAPTEQVASFYRDFLQPTDLTLALRSDNLLPLESLKSIKSDTPENLDVISGLKTDANLDVESLKTAVNDASVRGETFSSVIENFLMPDESTASTIIVNSDTIIRLEWIGTNISDSRVPLDLTVNLVANFNFPSESFVSSTTNFNLPTEVLASSAADALSRNEWTSTAITVATDNLLRFELLPTLRSDLQAATEYLRNHRIDSVLVQEVTARQLVDIFTRAETLASMTADNKQPVEFFVTVFRDSPATQEVIGQITSNIISPLETLLLIHSITTDAILNFEFNSGVSTVFIDQLLQYEFSNTPVIVRNFLAHQFNAGELRVFVVKGRTNIWNA